MCPRRKPMRLRQSNRGAVGPRLTNWRRMLEKEWHTMSFGDLQIETRDGQHHFQVDVIFGEVDPKGVQVELFAEEKEGRPWRQPMAGGDKLPGREGVYVFSAPAPATRPASDFTPRLIPSFPGVAVPLELPLILWPH